MRTARVRIPAIFVLAIALATAACVKPTTANIPGSVNNADAALYVALNDLQAAIDAAKQQVPAHPGLKPILNDTVGPNYQKALDAYRVYHASLVAGAPADATKAQQIMSQITAVKAGLAAALKAGGVQ